MNKNPRSGESISKLARVGKRATKLGLALALAYSSVASFLPAPAHAEDAPSKEYSTRVTMVQNMAPIASHEDYKQTLPTGLIPADENAVAELSLEDEGDGVPRSGLATPATDSSESLTPSEGGLDRMGRATTSTPLPCGTLLAPQVPEGFLPESLQTPSLLSSEHEPETAPSTVYEIGDERVFRSERREGDFTAQVVAVGDHFTIWVESARLDFISGEKLENLSQELGRAFEKMLDSFGSAERFDIDQDGKIAFVFHELHSEDVAAAGYFAPIDLFSRDQLEASGDFEFAQYTNEMDMVHLNLINQREPDNTFTFNSKDAAVTLIHELQHLINYAQTGGQSESWLDEAFSQSATAITGHGEYSDGYLFDMSYIAAVFGYTPPFIFQGKFAPNDDDEERPSVAYGQWYLFGRYIANQTKGFEGGGDRLYKTVFDASRDAAGFGRCTTGSLVAALENMGYMGSAPGYVASDFGELVENYNRALLVRDFTGPYSLTNEANANPSIIDGPRFQFLGFPETPRADIRGGGAATFRGAEAGSDTTTSGSPFVASTTFDSPLPLRFHISFDPLRGYQNEQSRITLDSPELATVPGSYLQYAAVDEETDKQGVNPLALSYTRYIGPIPPFPCEAYVLYAEFACDRGDSIPQRAGYYRFFPTPPAQNPSTDAAGSESAGSGNESTADVASGGVPLARTGDAMPIVALAVLALLATSTVMAFFIRRKHSYAP